MSRPLSREESYVRTSCLALLGERWHMLETPASPLWGEVACEA